MKKLILVATLTIIAGLLTQNTTLAETASNINTSKKYAVVDVKKVVESSNSVQAVKEERKKQKEAVIKFIKDGNAQVAAEKDPAKKEALKKKLNNDLKYMTKTYDTKYKAELKKINDSMSADIAKIGKEQNYDLILTTDAVLYGGKNITNEVIKAVK